MQSCLCNLTQQPQCVSWKLDATADPVPSAELCLEDNVDNTKGERKKGGPKEGRITASPLHIQSPQRQARGAKSKADPESLTPTRGALHQSVDCESLTPTQGAMQHSVDCEQLEQPHNKAWIVIP